MSKAAARIDHEEHKRQSDIDRSRVPAELRKRRPAILVDSATQKADRADGREANDPPQNLAHDGEKRLIEGQERLGCLARFQCGYAKSNRYHEQLQHVEIQRCAGRTVVEFGRGFKTEDIGRNEALEEIEPGARGRRCCGCGICDRGVDPRLDDETKCYADHHRNERRNREPQQCLPDELGGIAQVFQIGNRGDDGSEDQRRNECAQQLHKDAANCLKRDGKPVLTACGIGANVARNEAKQQADDHGGQHLKAEITIKGFAPRGEGTSLPVT